MPNYVPRPGTNAEKIHDYIIAHPEQKRPVEIMEGLAAEGVSVTNTQVCQIQRQMAEAGTLPQKQRGKQGSAADRIRSYLRANPGASAREVADACQTKMQNVYCVRSDLKTKRKSKRSARKAKAKPKAAPNGFAEFGIVNEMHSLSEEYGLEYSSLRELAEVLSGHDLQQVAAALSCLEKISGK